MPALLGCQLGVKRERYNDSCLLKYANVMRSKDWFNDTTVGVGTQRILANRMVLACYSGYFEDKFLIRVDCNPSVSITDMDEKPVVKLIEFIYTKELIINHENVLSLFSTALKLKIESAVQLCVEYFQSAINMKNCYFILNEANLHKIDSLNRVACKFMSENFKVISKYDKFKELSKYDLSSCISITDRNKTSETFLYEAIIKWINHKSEERKSNFSELFLQLNLDQLPNDYLLQVVANECLVLENSICSEVVLQRMTNLMEITKLTKVEKKILTLGGNRTGSKVIEVFSLANENLKVYPDLPVGIYAHCTVIIDETLFCIGGQLIDYNRFIDLFDHNRKLTNKVWQMKLKHECLEWKEIAGMNDKRWLMGATVYKNVLVISGGHDAKVTYNSTEVYTKPLNRWESISSLNEARGSHCVVTCGDWLYAIGGDGGGDNILSSVERLPNLHGKWRSTQSLLTPRRWFVAVCLKGSIFAIGGYSGSGDSSTLKSVEVFDPDMMTWKYVKGLNIARNSHAACVLDEKIYVVGGLDASNNPVREIECYDLTRDEWRIVGKTNEELFNHTLVAI